MTKSRDPDFPIESGDLDSKTEKEPESFQTHFTRSGLPESAQTCTLMRDII